MKNHKKIGDSGEVEALVFLKNKGFSILETNYVFGKVGEVDIVGKIGETIVFFEVKKRTGLQHGLAVETLTKNKKSKLFLTMQHYCLSRRVGFENIRFDFIAIQDGEISHFENVSLSE